jgi:PAS domain-containing protein
LLALAALSDSAAALLYGEQVRTQQSEEHYRQIVETSQEGVWLIGLDGRTRYVNARMACMTSASAAVLRSRWKRR